MKTNLLFAHALTPLHPGTGQGLGIVDLPIAREVATGLPYLPGSSLKGVLRDRSNAANRFKVFGPDAKSIVDNNAYAGAAQFSDLRLLLLPVRSLAGTFAWVTSPFVLHRLKRECKYINHAGVPQIVPEPNSLSEAVVTAEGTKTLVLADGSGGIYLEDLDLTPRSSTACGEWSNWIGEQMFPDDADWKRLLSQRLAIVHNDVFSFLLETATEIIARIASRMKAKL